VTLPTVSVKGRTAAAIFFEGSAARSKESRKRLWACATSGISPIAIASASAARVILGQY